LKSEFVFGEILTECGAKYCMQPGVRTDRRVDSEKVEKALTKAIAVFALATEEASVVMVVAAIALRSVFQGEKSEIPKYRLDGVLKR
jgi:hypothetical protein